MKKLLFLLIASSFSVYSAKDIFDNMDEKLAISTGIYKLSSSEKTELVKWLAGDREQARKEIKQEVRSEVIAEVKQEVRAEVEGKIKAEVTADVIKKQKKKFMGFIPNLSDREEITSSIIGEFKGWRGKNVFKLENGQVWRQAESGSFYIPKRNSPNITIKPKSMGTWILYVDGFGRGVKVKRIK